MPNTEQTPTETEALERLRFSSIVKWLLGHEGGYTDNPADQGGPTKYGISFKSYPTLDIKNLTREQAAEIYYNEWWRPLRLSFVDDDRLAAKVLDTCVNAGRYAGTRILQQALAERGHNVPVDGYMHQSVIDACNKANVDKLLLTYIKYQCKHYADCISNKPSNAVFARGWHNRAWSIYSKGE